MSPTDALDKIKAGAWLIQIYTGMVYAGPGLPSAINRALVQECQREGLSSVTALRPHILSPSPGGGVPG